MFVFANSWWNSWWFSSRASVFEVNSPPRSDRKISTGTPQSLWKRNRIGIVWSSCWNLVPNFTVICNPEAWHTYTSKCGLPSCDGVGMACRSNQIHFPGRISLVLPIRYWCQTQICFHANLAFVAICCSGFVRDGDPKTVHRPFIWVGTFYTDHPA